MIYILLSLLLIVIIVLIIWLIRYHLALVNLSQQIEDKIHTGSMKRIGVSTFSKAILITIQINIRNYKGSDVSEPFYIRNTLCII